MENLKKITFIECELGADFVEDDIRFLLDAAKGWDRLVPVCEDANNTSLFGFLPKELCDQVEFNEALFRRELRLYANDWNYQPKLDPKFGYELVFQQSFAK